MVTACLSGLRGVSWDSVLRGMDDGFTNAFYTCENTEPTCMETAHLCFGIFKLQQSLYLAGFTVAKPIAYTFIGANLFTKFVLAYIQNYDADALPKDSWRKGAVEWIRGALTVPYKEVTQEVRGKTVKTSVSSPSYYQYPLLLCEAILENTALLLRVAHLCEVFIKPERNWTQAIAKGLTINAVIYSKWFEEKHWCEHKDDSLSSKILHNAFFFLRNIAPLQTKIYTLYKVCSAGSYMNNLQNVYEMGCAVNVRNLLSSTYAQPRATLSSLPGAILKTVKSINVFNHLNTANEIYEGAMRLGNTKPEFEI